MRLINADALKEKAFGKRDGLIHTSDIDAMPTVDAIPVFVIETVIMMSKAHDDSLVQLSASPLVALLKTWKKITEDKNNE